MGAADIISIIFGACGLAGSVFGVLVWIGQQKATIAGQGREIGELKRSLSELAANTEAKLAAHSDNHLLVARLDERLAGLERTLREQPQIIALCVGEAIKAALKVSRQRVA